MKYSKKKIELGSVVTIITLIFLLVIYTYYLINSELNSIKTKLESKINEQLNIKISIGNIKPFLFWGVKLQNIKCYTDNTNKLLADIGTLIIKIKIKDILFHKIKLENSIYNIQFENLELNLLYKNKKWNFQDILLADRSNKTNNILPAINFDNCNINIKYKNIKSVININTGKIDLKKQNFSFNNLVKAKINNMNYASKLFITGHVTNNKIKSAVILKDMKIDKYVKIPQEIFLDIDHYKKTINFSAKDLGQTFSAKGLYAKNNYKISFNFYKFKTLHYLFNGKGRISPISGFCKLLIKNFITRDEYRIDIEKKRNTYKINKIMLFKNKNHFLKATGRYKSNKNFFIKLWVNNYKIKNFNLYGKSIIFSDKNKNTKFELINFKINKYKINHIKFKYYIKKNKKKLDTIVSKDNVRLYITAPINKKKMFAVIKSKNFPILRLNDLLNKSVIPNDLNSSLSGKINIAFNPKTKYFKLKYYTLLMKLKNNEIINDIYTVFDKQNIKFKIKLKNHKTIRTSSKISKNNIFTIIKYNKNKVKLNTSIFKDNDKYKIFSKIPNILSFNGIIYNTSRFNFNFKINRKNYKFIKSLSSRIKISGNLKKLNDIQFSSTLNFKNTADDKITYYMYRKKNKILFKNINFTHKDINLNGRGEYNLKNNKININLKKIFIKGKISQEKTDMYIIFSKIKNVKIENLIYNINGLIKIYAEKNFSGLSILGDINFYNIRYKNFKINDSYVKFKFADNNLNINKFNMELYKGKAKIYNINFFKINNNLYTDFIITAENIKYNSVNINAKAYAKIKLQKNFFAKIKLFYFNANNFRIKKLEEVFWMKKNRLKIKRISYNGIEGNIKKKKNKTLYNLKFKINNNYIKYTGYTTSKNIKSKLSMNNFNIDSINKILKSINIKDGVMDLNLSFTGNKKSPNISGKIKGKDFYLKFPDTIKKLTDFNFIIEVTNNVAIIKKMKGDIDGAFGVTGNIGLKNYKISTMNINFKTLSDKGILISRNNSEIMGNVLANLKITGNQNNIFIGGKLTPKNFEFTWPLSGLYSDEEGSGKGTRTKINFNIDIIAGEKVKFFQTQNNLEIWVKPGGKFHINGDINNEHKVVGVMEADNGNIDYFGTYFKLDYATVSFSEAYEDNTPWIHAKAEANVKGKDNENIVLTMIVEGLADNDLTPKLYSSPALSQREIFSLLNNSSFYVNTQENGNLSETKISELLKIGFLQIFYTTYRTKFFDPLQRKIKKNLGLDILNIKTDILQNLLEPKFIGSTDKNSSFNDLINNTELSVGKYITDNMLLKYSLLLRENSLLSDLNYYHQLGIEIRILRSLSFEWLYKPVFLNEFNDIEQYEQKYRLEWRKKLSF